MPGRKMGLPLEDRKAVMDEAMRMMAAGDGKQEILDYCHENGCDWTWNYLRGEASTRDVRRPKAIPSMDKLLPSPEPDTQYLYTIKSAPDGERALYIPDVHIPYWHGQAVGLMRRFAKDFRPDKIFILGDLVDFYTVSKFDQNPLRQNTLADEINWAVSFLAGLRGEHPNAEIYYTFGNHEDRLRSYIWKNAPALAGVPGATIFSLLRLRELDIKATPYGGSIDYLRFRITHGNRVSQHSAFSAKAHLEKDVGGSLAMGHVHRRGTFCVTNANGSHSGYELGCLCDLNPQYIKGNANWQLGFGYSRVHEKMVHFHQAAIFEGKGVEIEGEYYKL